MNELRIPVFLSIVGNKTFNFLQSLVHPAKAGTKIYDDLTKILEEYYSPKPLIIAECFRFHRRNQKEDEIIAQFVAILKMLAQH